MDELQQVPLGRDRVQAQVIAEACRAAGLRVKLFLADDSGYGPVEAHRLLVYSDELDKVMAVVEQSDTAPHARPSRRPEPPSSSPPDPPDSRD